MCGEELRENIDNSPQAWDSPGYYLRPKLPHTEHAPFPPASVRAPDTQPSPPSPPLPPHGGERRGDSGGGGITELKGGSEDPWVGVGGSHVTLIMCCNHLFTPSPHSTQHSYNHHSVIITHCCFHLPLSLFLPSFHSPSLWFYLLYIILLPVFHHVFPFSLAYETKPQDIECVLVFVCVFVVD